MSNEKKYAVFERLEGAEKDQRFIDKIEINSFYPPAYTEVLYLSDAELAEKITKTGTDMLMDFENEIINKQNTNTNDK